MTTEALLQLLHDNAPALYQIVKARRKTPTPPIVTTKEQEFEKWMKEDDTKKLQESYSPPIAEISRK